MNITSSFYRRESGKKGMAKTFLLCGLSLSMLGILPSCGLVCPDDQDEFAEMNKSTYAVVVKYKTGPNEQDVQYFTLATCFAIGEHLLGTNSHVTEFFREGQPFPIEDVFGVQSGTGKVVKLLRALTHPDYTGDPLSSPDVGVLTVQESLPSWLPLADDLTLSDLSVGDGLLLAGFPGDVNDSLPITPGVTVPQATNFSGTITALRSHDVTQVVTPTNVDMLQHQIPTTGGTSGSALVRCGLVVAVHNAGISKSFVIVGNDGQLTSTVLPTAANSFGVHVKYMREMKTLFDAQSIQGFALPPAFIPQNNQGGGQNNIPAQFTGNFQGTMTQQNAQHTLTFTVGQDGKVTGTSTWPQTGNFNLTGTVDANGNFNIQDDAMATMGFNTGIYVGKIDANGQINGSYYEGDTNNFIGNWTGVKM